MSYGQKVQSIEYFINQVLLKHSHTYLFCTLFVAGYIQPLLLGKVLCNAAKAQKQPLVILSSEFFLLFVNKTQKMFMLDVSHLCFITPGENVRHKKFKSTFCFLSLGFFFFGDVGPSFSSFAFFLSFLICFCFWFSDSSSSSELLSAFLVLCLGTFFGGCKLIPASAVQSE